MTRMMKPLDDNRQLELLQ